MTVIANLQDGPQWFPPLGSSLPTLDQGRYMWPIEYSRYEGISLLRCGYQRCRVSSIKNSTTNSHTKRQDRNSSFWKISGVYRKEIYLLISEHVLVGQGSLGHFSKSKRAGGCHFPAPTTSLDTWIPVGTILSKHSPSSANSMPCPMLLQICPLQPT